MLEVDDRISAALFPISFAALMTEVALTRRSLAAAVLLVVCLLVVTHVPFDPAELFPGGHFSAGNDPRQFPYMSIFYVAVTAPFLAAGNRIAAQAAADLLVRRGLVPVSPAAPAAN